tara:strand:- start:1610 stop:2317 length:708 start_codon:yes stop_codon:yes gene_type:complete
MKKVIFISPMYNASAHIPDLIESIKEQRNENWEHILIDDMSTDESFELAKKLTSDDNRFTVIKNKQKKWALKNVVEVARKYQNDSEIIIANIDGDDALCNENTVDILFDAYEDHELDTAWTAHTWDINGMNISGEIQENINPYQTKWKSSHLKTWRASTLLGVSDDNFKDLDGNWFKRGYDQALYLPLLYLSHKRKFLNEICYLYRINSQSVEVRVWSDMSQLDTVRLVRARGFV